MSVSQIGQSMKSPVGLSLLSMPEISAFTFVILLGIHVGAFEAQRCYSKSCCWPQLFQIFEAKSTLLDWPDLRIYSLAKVRFMAVLSRIAKGIERSKIQREVSRCRMEVKKLN